MAKINLNQSPYFDDYSEQDKYYQILFKPGKAVQARELTQLQTILQKQIERIGSHMFKDGAQVLPSNERGVRYIANNGFIKLPQLASILTQSSVSIEQNWLNKKIRNEAGVEATVIGYRPVDGLNEIRLFLTYNKASDDGLTLIFYPGDNITLIDSTPLIVAQIPSANLQDGSILKKTGSVASVVVNEGVYFYSGFFVFVEKQTLFITPPIDPDSIESQNAWDNQPTASIGLVMNQSIKTSEQDPNLLDVALGSPNYSAPGADRLHIDAVLTQKIIRTDQTKSDDNYIELVSVNRGEVTYRVLTADYNALEATLARRTFDESGDYTVTPFGVQIKEFLRTEDNNGVHDETEFFSYTPTEAAALAASRFNLTANDVPTGTNTYSVHPNFSNPTVYLPGTSYDGSEITSFKNLCDQYLSARVDPGKAYVKGYEIQKLARTTVDIPKARTVEYKINQTCFTPLGIYLEVTDVFGAPNFSIHPTVELYSSQYDTTTRSVPSSDKIGTAKMLFIDFFEGISGTGSSGRYRLYLYDIEINDGVDFEKIKSFRSASTSVGSTDFYANAVLSQLPLTGSVSRLPSSGQTAQSATSSSTGYLYGTGTKWKNDAVERLVAGDLIRVGSVVYRVEQTPSTDNEILVLPNPVNTNTSAWTNGASFTYLYCLPQTNSSEASLVFKLPDQYVASIREGGADPLTNPFSKTTASANYTIPKVFSGKVPSGTGLISLTSELAANEKFALFSNQYVVISERTGRWLRVISGSSAPSDNNMAVIQQTQTTLNVWVREDSDGDGIPDQNDTPGTAAKYTIIAPILLSQAIERKKVLRKGHFDASGNYVSTFSVINNGTPVTSAGTGGGFVLVDGLTSANISLHMADVLRITRVVESLDPTQPPSGKKVLNASLERDITALYNFNDGQKDYYYDIASVTLKPGISRPTGKVRVEFDYFDHVNDSGKYFSIDSYGIRNTGSGISYGEIPTFTATDGTLYKLADCIDFRKKITDVVERVSIDNFNCNYYVYLGRRDKIILNSTTKTFELSQGSPAEVPLPADEISTGMTICDLDLEPYTPTVNSVTVTPVNNKRYTMKDIGKLEQRIKTLEYYTSLTLLELDTATLNIKNANGENRFKNGFLADNFSGDSVSDLNSLDFKCAIDDRNREARPLIFEDAISLYEAALDEASPDTYRKTKTAPYQKTGDLFTLPYRSVILLRQGLASKTISVNPFNIQSYVGDIKLSPWSDEWRETKLLPDIKKQDSTAFDSAMAAVGPTGTSTVYNNTVNNWTGSSQSDWQATGKEILHVAGHDVLEQLFPNKKKKDWPKFITVPEPYANAGAKIPVGRSSSVSQQLRATTSLTGSQILMGLQTSVKDLGWSPENRALTLIESSQIQWMRSREIEFVGHCFRPNARLYAFFDDVAVSENCRPVGDSDWVSFVVLALNNVVTIHTSSPNQTFSTTTYNIRPGAELVYNSRKFEVVSVTNGSQLIVAPKDIPGSNSTSTALTLNTATSVQITKYTYGDHLQADAYGSIKGVFKIPATESKKFKTGDAVFRLTTSSINARFPNPLAQNTSMGDARFTSRGWLDTQQYTITQTRLFEVSSSLVSTTGGPINMGTGDVYSATTPVRRDPIAQTFLIEEEGGCFITSIDVFFFSKSTTTSKAPNAPITLELRAVRDGAPIEVLPAGKLGVVVKQSQDVITNTVDLSKRELTVTGSVGGTSQNNKYVWTKETQVCSENLETGATTAAIVSGVPFVSTDMAKDMVPTRFTFESPIFLEQNKDYSFVLLSDSDDYEVWIAEIGTNDEKTPKFNPRSGMPNYKIGTQIEMPTPVYEDGNFYKSHNASGWAIDNKVTTMFTLRKAEFIGQTAEINFVNQELFPTRIFTDGIEVKQGSNRMRVVLPNHGLSINDKVRITNITTPPDTGLTTIKGFLPTIFSDLKVVRTEIDHIIVEHSSGSTAAGHVATSTGRIGGSSAIILDNRRFEELLVLTTPFLPPTTTVEWKLITTSSGGITNQPHAAQKLPFTNFSVNEKRRFDSSMRINSILNEDSANTSLPEWNLKKKSLIVTAVLRTANKNISPVLDKSRFTAALVMNRLDNPTGIPGVAQNINDVFDTVHVLAVADGAGSDKVHFSTSSGVLQGTFNSQDGTVTRNGTGISEDLRNRLAPGVKVFNPTSGQTVVVREVLGADEFTTTVAFNPALSSATLYGSPTNMTIKTGNSLIAQKLSQLDVGKYVTLAGASSGANFTRNFENKLVLKVNYTPGATENDVDLGSPCLAKIEFDFQTNAGAGTEDNNFTLTQLDRFIDETAPSGGSCSAKYVCKKLVVSRVSNALKITFDASRDETCNLELYYKLEKPNSTTSLDDQLWIKAPFNVDVNGVLQNKTPAPDPSGNVYSSYESTINDLIGFVGVQAKIVMKGGNAGKPPKIKNFRLIAIDE